MTGKPSLANMASNADLEKDLESGRDQENGTTRTESTYPSDIEKAESNTLDEGAIGTPDLDHDEVEQMDAGHLDDLIRQHVRLSHIPSFQCVLITVDHNFYQSRPIKRRRRARHFTN